MAIWILNLSPVSPTVASVRIPTRFLPGVILLETGTNRDISGQIPAIPDSLPHRGDRRNDLYKIETRRSVSDLLRLPLAAVSQAEASGKGQGRDRVAVRPATFRSGERQNAPVVARGGDDGGVSHPSGRRGRG